MELLTRQTLVNGLVEKFKRWEANVSGDRYIARLRERGLGRPVDELLKLGPNPHPAACDAVLRQQLDQHTWPSGNTPSWTTLHCGECGRAVNALVVFDAEDEHYGVNVCRACLVQAIYTINEPASPEAP
jgi:hypothetical protein